MDPLISSSTCLSTPQESTHRRANAGWHTPRSRAGGQEGEPWGQVLHSKEGRPIRVNLSPTCVPSCGDFFVTPWGIGCYEHLREGRAVPQHPTVTEYPHHEKSRGLAALLKSRLFGHSSTHGDPSRRTAPVVDPHSTRSKRTGGVELGKGRDLRCGWSGANLVWNNTSCMIYGEWL